MKYIKKDSFVEAIQYRREENISAVQTFFEEKKDPVQMFRYQETLNEYGVVVRHPHGTHDLHILEAGEYIVRHPGGHYEVLPEAIFKKRYERVTV